MVLDELGEVGERATLAAAEVPSKEGIMVQDALMRVCVGVKGIKSIDKTALEGVAFKRVNVAMPAAAKKLKQVGSFMSTSIFQHRALWQDAVDAVQTGTLVSSGR